MLRERERLLIVWGGTKPQDERKSNPYEISFSSRSEEEEKDT